MTGIAYSQGYYGMGPGMMGGYGYGPGYRNETCQKFLNDTAGLRKQLHEKRYDYFEAMRNPQTKPEDLAKEEEAIRDLQEKIYAKNPQGCWW